ncbi:MAG TPA: hypothetical protein ENJ87_01150 [Gammaproteobacteria bacterium]|nr:hypothetical protein [Gammaproteobacteria bacterium]
MLEELTELGIQIDFDYHPINEVVCFDPAGTERIFRSQAPLFYLLHRGKEKGSFDYALKQQALKAGVEIRFKTRISKLPEGGIVTEGPHRADILASGYLFDTDMADGMYAVVSDDLAPKGYAYLLIHQGRGTLSSCMFRGFHGERNYLEQCVDFFQTSVGLRMKNPHRFGGVGNSALPKKVKKLSTLYAGEVAGFQDPLFGFGIRWAVVSGVAAGNAMASGDLRQYETIIKKRLKPHYQSAATNRWFYEKLGNRGYSKTLKHFPPNRDVRKWLQRAYAPCWWKRVWYMLIVSRSVKPLLDLSKNCDCTWCRCKR